MDDVVLECRNLSHWFGAKKVLYNISFRIQRGSVVALVGPSGCGKSTLLRAILGTHPPRAGEVLMNGCTYRHPGRQRGIVYQRYSLFPFLTAEGNVAFGPLLDKTNLLFRFFRPGRTRRFRRALERKSIRLLERLQLGSSTHHYPDQLSGGMQQRVALAQALIMRPEILLLDEPFGALDEATREEMQLMLLQLFQENVQAKANKQAPPHTILIVTHELNEALYVSNRVLGLSQYHADGVHGATIVYDKPAPVFRPEDERDFSKFVAQKEELRKIVFDPEHVQHHAEYVSVLNALPDAT
jgi:NitT/TauT family transport system ATP-binding protein